MFLRLLRREWTKMTPKQKRRRVIEPYSHDDVLWNDVRALLGTDTVRSADWESPFHFREEIDVVVDRLSSHGDALALGPPHRQPWVIVAPFALPGEHIRVRVYRSAHLHSFADLVSVITPNPDWRDDSRVQCKYFGKCSGCQYQVRLIPYIDRVLISPRCSTMKNSSTSNATSSSRHTTTFQARRVLPCPSVAHVPLDLTPSQVPTVLPTIGSPKQYHYRTKITPHFEAPPKKARDNPTPNPDWLKIGFNEIGKKSVIDIEVSLLLPPTPFPHFPQGMSHRHPCAQPSSRSHTGKHHPVSYTYTLPPHADPCQKHMDLQKGRLPPPPRLTRPLPPYRHHQHHPRRPEPTHLRH